MMVLILPLHGVRRFLHRKMALLHMQEIVLKRFGNLLLVRHSDGWTTAYAHIDKVLVRKGDTVKRGETIGTIGTSGKVNRPQLHFEIRKGSQAIDPMTELAA